MKNLGTFTRFVAIAAVAALALAAAPAAAAADSGDHDWTGAYVGANVGAGMSSGKIDDPDCYDCNSAAFNERLLQTGVNAGYEKQFGVAVLGAEAEINWGSQNHRGIEEQHNTSEEASVVSRVDWSAALLARLGMAVQNSQFYVGAGPAVARASGNYNEPNSDYFAAYSNWQPGFKAEVGTEFMVSRNVSVRAQYSLLEIADRTVYGYNGGPGSTGRTVWTNSQSVATIGAAWHF